MASFGVKIGSPVLQRSQDVRVSIPGRAPVPRSRTSHVKSVDVVSSRALKRDSFRMQATVPETPPATTSGGNVKVMNTVVITGASSGLGLYAAKALVEQGWHVVMAVRDWAKAEAAARKFGFPDESYTIMHLDLAAMSSVRNFVKTFRESGRQLDCLVCNAAVYLPTAKEPTFTADGFELSVGTNHLGHFLLVNLMLEDLRDTVNTGKQPRCIVVGSVTGNTNTLAGQIPPKADLGALQGMERGFQGDHVMINDGDFDGAKAYKDSKVCNMLTMRELNNRFGKDGIVFSSLYPGCIADTQLFRRHTPFFRWSFPKLQRNLTKGYVSQEDAGKRLALLVAGETFTEPGAYWSWREAGDDLWDNFNAKDGGAYVNEPSQEVTDAAKGQKLWDLSMKLTGLA